MESEERLERVNHSIAKLLSTTADLDSNPESILDFRTRRALELQDRIERNGKPLFKEEDIYATQDILSRLVRKYCVDRNITDSYFTTMYRVYGESLNMLPQQIQHQTHNLKRALYKASITKKIFEDFFNAMGVQVLEYSVTLLDSNRQQLSYKVSKCPEISKVKPIEGAAPCLM